MSTACGNTLKWKGSPTQRLTFRFLMGLLIRPQIHRITNHHGKAMYQFKAQMLERIK